MGGLPVLSRQQGGPSRHLPPSAPQLIHTAPHPSRRNLGTHRACREVRWYAPCRIPLPASPLFTAGTMFELVKALNDGARVLSERSPNPISLNAGCELFIAFVTLFPHDSDVSAPAPIPRHPHHHTSFKELLRSQNRAGKAGPEIRHRGSCISRKNS